MITDTNIRLIHTGLYAEHTARVLGDFITAIQTQYRAKKQTFKIASMCAITVDTAPDNEIVIVCNRYRKSYWTKPQAFEKWNDARALEHIGWEMKQYVLRILTKASTAQRAHDAWRRTNNDVFNFGPEMTTIAEIYFIYELFIGRKGAAKRYDAKMVEDIRGEALDPIMTEMIIAKAEEKKRIADSLSDKLTELERQCNEELSKVRKEVYAKFDLLKAEARKKNEEELKAVDDELAFLTKPADDDGTPNIFAMMGDQQ